MYLVWKDGASVCDQPADSRLRPLGPTIAPRSTRASSSPTVNPSPRIPPSGFPSSPSGSTSEGCAPGARLRRGQAGDSAKGRGRWLAVKKIKVGQGSVFVAQAAVAREAAVARGGGGQPEPRSGSRRSISQRSAHSTLPSGSESGRLGSRRRPSLSRNWLTGQLRYASLPRRGLQALRRAARLRRRDPRLLRARGGHTGAARAAHQEPHRAPQPGDLLEDGRARLARRHHPRAVRRLRRHHARRLPVHGGDLPRDGPDRRLRDHPDRRRRHQALRHRGRRRRRSSAASPPARWRRSR